MVQNDRGRWCWNCWKISDEALIPAPETDSVFTVYVCKKCYKRIKRFSRIALIILMIFIIAQMIILRVFYRV